MPSSPSITLTPATTTTTTTTSTEQPSRDVFLSNGQATVPRNASTATITNNYRNRYALYLAAQFNISEAAAFAEIDEQLRLGKARKGSEASEAEIRDVRGPDSV
ncbi:uncharacterized protein K452DRAFT_322850 [Aplosporella prunicola CBS 121167]|uniref:Uncharacterized protein n=1 Tax=Aplosporella prunicola CBS 121167 TaxID=1176127 RepID=A0A6A6AZA8_9PEZI|nr:uncharacterized protein K452DRAFT_322850 [Aplosporella prunicola CBS 121167]KAF2135801.1 hypothetical protein K452DRAFT_322850 [Aplosporella prunicola CBS 121167]